MSALQRFKLLDKFVFDAFFERGFHRAFDFVNIHRLA